MLSHRNRKDYLSTMSPILMRLGINSRIMHAHYVLNLLSGHLSMASILAHPPSSHHHSQESH